MRESNGRPQPHAARTPALGRSGRLTAERGRVAQILRLFLGEQLADLRPLRFVGRLGEEATEAFEVLLVDEGIQGHLLTQLRVPAVRLRPPRGCAQPSCQFHSYDYVAFWRGEAIVII